MSSRTGYPHFWTPHISHHLRVLAESELVEEVPELARDRRERWWRRTSARLRWSNSDFPDDPVADAATSLNLDHAMGIARASYADRDIYGDEWYQASFMSDTWLKLTPKEGRQLAAEMGAVVGPGHPRRWSGPGVGVPVRLRYARAAMKDFRLLWLGETVSLVGSSVGSVALTLVAVVALHADAFVVGLLNGAYWLPWLVIGLLAGAWIDRLGRHRRVMMACDAVSLVAFASVPVAAWCGVLGVAQLVVVAVVGGCAKVFFTIAYRAFVPALVSDDALMSANAKLQGSESSAQVVGPGLAGLLAQLVDATVGMLADAVSFGVSWVCLGRMRDRRVAPAPRRRLRTDIAAGLRFIAYDPVLRVLVCFGAVSNLALTGFNTVAVVYLVQDVGASPGLVGVTYTLAGVGGVAGSVVAGWLARRWGSARAVVVCQAVALPSMLLAPVGGLGVFVVSVFALGMGVTASNVIQGTFRQRYCPPELFGRITAASSVINYGTIPLGGVLGGLCGDAIGLRTALWLMAAMAAGSVLILVSSRLRLMREFPVGRWTSVS